MGKWLMTLQMKTIESQTHHFGCHNSIGQSLAVRKRPAQRDITQAILPPIRRRRVELAGTFAPAMKKPPVSFFWRTLMPKPIWRLYLQLL